jgi:hypothetical protein
LQQALVRLTENAAKEPGNYLPALTSINKVLNGNFSFEDLDIAGGGLLKIVGSSDMAPVKARTGPDRKLSDQYFRKTATIND